MSKYGHLRIQSARPVSSKHVRCEVVDALDGRQDDADPAGRKTLAKSKSMKRSSTATLAGVVTRGEERRVTCEFC